MIMLIFAALIVVVSGVAIGGIPQVGQTLTALISPSNANANYVWKVDGTIAGTGA
jgi:hypothetical protein